MNEIDVGVLLLRLMLAALLAGHALQKSLGWFHGNGLARTAELFEGWGFVPGRPQVVLAATCELVAAASLASGLFFRAGCAIAVGTMVVAASPAVPNGFWTHRGGYELPATYAGIAACLAIAGPGRVALDRALDLPDGGTYGGVVAVLAGALAAIPALHHRRLVLSRPSTHRTA